MDTHTESHSSSSTATLCLVKSKYLGNWEERALEVDLSHSRLVLRGKDNKTKVYPLTQVTVTAGKDEKVAHIRVSKEREYEIQDSEGIGSRISEIKMFHDSQFFLSKVPELQIPAPKKLNYYAPLRSHSYEEGFVPVRGSMSLARGSMRKQKLQEYPRRPSFINEEDWRRDQIKGGVLLVNEQKKSNISKIVAFICKKVISTGSFMGISFPTFAMKPESMLETYCKCLGIAPLVLDECPRDPVPRIQAFNAIILTLSLQFNDLDKPFNPAIGETFQGEIGGYNIYAEQTSHHPPISSFLLDGKDYVLHGSLELNAKLGFNSAVGMFYGEITLEFDDGGVVKGRMPCGVMSNIMFGSTHFGPEGACYSYDPINHLVCSYSVASNDILQGYIGTLKEKSYRKFLALLAEKKLNRYESFKPFSEKDYDHIASKMEAKWTEYIAYDGHQFINYLQERWLPLRLTQEIKGEKILQSDSSHRVDIAHRAQNRMEDAQSAKQEIEEEERRLRKLRQKGNGV